MRLNYAPNATCCTHFVLVHVCVHVCVCVCTILCVRTRVRVRACVCAEYWLSADLLLFLSHHVRRPLTKSVLQRLKTTGGVRWRWGTWGNWMKFVLSKERSKFCTDIYYCQEIFEPSLCNNLHYAISFHLHSVYVNISPGEFWDLLLSLPSSSAILLKSDSLKKSKNSRREWYASLNSTFFAPDSYSTQRAVKPPGATALLSFWIPNRCRSANLGGWRTILSLLKEAEGQFYLYLDCTILSLPQTLLPSPTTHERAFVYGACTGTTEVGVSLVAPWARGGEEALALSCRAPPGHNPSREKYQCQYPFCSTCGSRKSTFPPTCHNNQNLILNLYCEILGNLRFKPHNQLFWNVQS